MNLIPIWVKALAVAALMALVAWGVHLYNDSLREDGRQEVRHKWGEAVRKAQAIQDEREAAVRAKQKESDDAAAAQLVRAAADAAGARDAADRLRKRVGELVAAARRPPSSAQPTAGQRPSEQGSDPLDLLTFMFSRTDDAAGELAKYADRLRAAGERCERGHDAEVSPDPQP